MLIGHKYLVKNFLSLVKSEKLAHGYIFFGESGIGKFYFAKHLANFLENGKFEPTKKVLQDAFILEAASGIDEMRSLKSFLWQTPVFSKKRVVIVNDAEHLTFEAQNAILKITEEPPERALIIIIARHIDSLLPPLVSRLQKIYFGRLSDEEMKEISPDTKLVAAAFGRPGRLETFKSLEFKEASDFAAEFLKYEGVRRSQFVKQLIDAQKEKPELLDMFFEALISKTMRDPIGNIEIIKSALHRLFLIKSYNTNKRLQVDAIL